MQQASAEPVAPSPASPCHASRRLVKTTPHPRRRGGQSASNENRESLT